jgi:hypothetical protein
MYLLFLCSLFSRLCLFLFKIINLLLHLFQFGLFLLLFSLLFLFFEKLIQLTLHLLILLLIVQVNLSQLCRLGFLLLWSGSGSLLGSGLGNLGWLGSLNWLLWSWGWSWCWSRSWWLCFLDFHILGRFWSWLLFFLYLLGFRLFSLWLLGFNLFSFSFFSLSILGLLLLFDLDHLLLFLWSLSLESGRNFLLFSLVEGSKSIIECLHEPTH